MVEQVVAGDDHRRDDAEPLQAGQHVHAGGLLDVRTGNGKQRRQRDERNGAEVLEQQHRKAEPPVAGGEVAGLLHDLQRECRRGQRQRKADEDGGLPREAQQQRRRGEYGAGRADLRAAEPEHGVAHRPQALGPQLEPDDEQQEHDAELGEIQDLLGLVATEQPSDG